MTTVHCNYHDGIMFPRVNHVRFVTDGLHMQAQAHTAGWHVRPRFRQLFPRIQCA